MTKFFRTSEDSVVDRLLAETFAQQESVSDPIGDVLGTLERVSLQNASNLGRVVDNTYQSPPTEDSTLMEYKEAVFLNYETIEEELPLSGSHNPVKDIENLQKKKTGKRKINDAEQKPRLRSGVRTKRVKRFFDD